MAKAEPSVLLGFWAASLLAAGASGGRSCWGPSGKTSTGWVSTLAPCSATVFTGIMHGVVDFLLLAMVTGDVVISRQELASSKALQYKS